MSAVAASRWQIPMRPTWVPLSGYRIELSSLGIEEFVNRKLACVPNGLILSGDIIDAAEAYRIGLVDELVPDAHVIERAEAVLKKIIANAQRAWRCKSAGAPRFVKPRRLRTASSLYLSALRMPKEAIAAFFARRPPDFTRTANVSAAPKA
jgi:enoyl-CoA hydratase/carnithine racemase